MAPLTWRNVNAPDFASSARILGNAGRGLGDGLDSISGVFKDARARQINTRSNEGIGQLAGANTESDVDRIMAQVLQGTAARDRNGALNDAIMSGHGRALGLDNDRADLRNTESMISSRNAASGRAASAAAAAREQADINDAARIEFYGANPAIVPEVLSNTAGSLVQVTEAPTPVTAPTETAPSMEHYKRLREGKAEENTNKDSAIDKALQAFANGEPMTQEIMDTIQGEYEDTGEIERSDNRSPNDPVSQAINGVLNGEPMTQRTMDAISGVPPYAGTQAASEPLYDRSRGSSPDGYNSDQGEHPNRASRPGRPGASIDGLPSVGGAHLTEFAVGNENFGQMNIPRSNRELPGPEGQVNRSGRPESFDPQARAQDRALANAVAPVDPSYGPGTGFRADGNIAGAFQNSVGPVTPSGSQVTDMTTLASPAQQAQIDQLMEENTDTATGEPVSPEAADEVFTTVAEMAERTGARFTDEQYNEMIGINQARLNRDRDTRQAEYTANVEEQLYNQLQLRGANGVEELTQIIRNNPDLSPRDREAYQSALKRFVNPEGNNAGYFTSTGTETFATEDQTRSLANDESFVTGQVALADGLSFDSRNLDLLGSAGDVSSTVDAVVASGDDGDLDRENVRSLLQNYHEDTGLPYSFIASQLDASLTGTWLNTKMGLSRSILDSHLGGFLGEDGRVDASRIARIRSAAETRKGIQTDMSLALSEIDSIDQEYRVLLDRPKSPEVDAQIEELRVKHAERMDDVTAARSQAGSLFGSPTVTPVLDENGNPVETTAPDPATDPVTGGADTRFQVPANTPTRQGYEVDPEASAWNRGWNQMNADGNVRTDMREIRDGLATGGASPANEFFGSLFDKLQPRAESDADSAARAAKREAFDWFDSNEATQLFTNNPMLLEAAKEDPEAFYQRIVNSR
jgi:hypothetical protein